MVTLIYNSKYYLNEYVCRSKHKNGHATDGAEEEGKGEAGANRHSDHYRDESCYKLISSACTRHLVNSRLLPAQIQAYKTTRCWHKLTLSTLAERPWKTRIESGRKDAGAWRQQSANDKGHGSGVSISAIRRSRTSAKYTSQGKSGISGISTIQRRRFILASHCQPMRQPFNTGAQLHFNASR